MSDNVDEKTLVLCEDIIKSSNNPDYVRAAKEIQEILLRYRRYTQTGLAEFGLEDSND